MNARRSLVWQSMRRQLLVIILSAATAAVAIAVAGGALDGGGSVPRGGRPVSPPALGELLDRLPARLDTLEYIDIAAAERQLHVAATRDPTLRYQDASESERRLEPGPSSVIDYLGGQNNPVGESLDRAIDHTRVTAAVRAEGSFSPGREGFSAIVLVATTQSAADIRRGVEHEHLKRVGPDAYRAPIHESAYRDLAFADGIFVLASSRTAALEAIRRKAPAAGNRLRRRLDAIRGAWRVIYAQPSDSCVTSIAGGERFDAHGDEDLVLTLREAPDPRWVLIGRGAQLRDSLTSDYRLGAVTVHGSTLRIALGLVPHAKTFSSAAYLTGEAGVDARGVYLCRSDRRTSLKALGLDLPPPPEPDRSGDIAEDLVSQYVAFASSAPTAVRVRCPGMELPTSVQVTCSATRAHPGGRYHYTLIATFGAIALDAVAVASSDDPTGTILDQKQSSEGR